MGVLISKEYIFGVDAKLKTAKHDELPQKETALECDSLALQFFNILKFEISVYCR